MDGLVKQFNFGSEGQGLHVYDWKGRKCVLAKEFGPLLDYASTNLLRLVRQNPNQFKEGRDYDVLTGNDLAEFNFVKSSEDFTKISSKVRNLMVIYETGINKVLLKTEKPIGVEIRNKLGEEVMPQLVRDEHYSPNRSVTDEGEMVGEIEGPKQSTSIIELIKPLQESKLYSDDTLRTLIADELEKVTGLSLPYLRPQAQVIKWLSQPEYRQATGLKLADILSAEKELNIEGNIPGVCEPTTAADPDYISKYLYKYSYKAVEMVCNYHDSFKPKFTE